MVRTMVMITLLFSPARASLLPGKRFRRQGWVTNVVNSCLLSFLAFGIAQPLCLAIFKPVTSRVQHAKVYQSDRLYRLTTTMSSKSAKVGLEKSRRTVLAGIFEMPLCFRTGRDPGSNP